MFPHCIELDLDDGRLRFYTREGELIPVNAVVETTYGRAKGPKVLNRVELDPNALIVLPDVALLKYDLLFAVDTNTRTIKGQRVSVSSFAYCRPFMLPDGRRGCAAYVTRSYEFRNCATKPELVGWQRLVEGVENDPMFRFGRVGVIVDSELGSLRAFNSRERAIAEDKYLPSRFEFVYASSDSGQECMANKMIRACDEESAAILDLIEKDAGDRRHLNPVPNRPFTHDRVWNTMNVPV